MLDLYLVRHPECLVNTTPDIIAGRSNDSPITELGFQQIYSLKKRFEEIGAVFDKIYSSPAIRCVEPCKILFPDQEIRVREELQEIHQGEWVGKPRKEMYTPEVKRAQALDSWNFAAPGGESQAIAGKRMYSLAQREIFPFDGKVAVLGHGVTTKSFLAELLDFRRSLAWRIALDNTSITHLQYDGAEWSLRTLNDTSHLYLSGIKNKGDASMESRRNA